MCEGREQGVGEDGGGVSGGGGVSTWNRGT